MATYYDKVKALRDAADELARALDPYVDRTVHLRHLKAAGLTDAKAYRHLTTIEGLAQDARFAAYGDS